MAASSITSTGIRPASQGPDPVHLPAKKTAEATCNGIRRFILKTLHGQFEFRLQRFRCDGENRTFFELTEQLSEAYLSRGLLELSTYYSGRLSYQEVEKLIERISGKRCLSDQRIWQAVAEKAVAISQTKADEIRQILQASKDRALTIAPKIDIYAPEQPEILLFEDGIQVKRQKSDRVSTSSRLRRADE